MSNPTTKMSSLIQTLSADTVLHILSFHSVSHSHLIDKPSIPHLLYGYFGDDPNRELHFLFRHFSVRCDEANETFACVFKHATTLRIKIKKLHSDCLRALSSNFRLERFTNEELSTSSSTVQSLRDSRKLYEVTLTSANQSDLKHLFSFPKLQILTVAKLEKIGDEVINLQETINTNTLREVNFGSRRDTAGISTLMEPVDRLFDLRKVCLNFQTISEQWLDNFSEKDKISNLDLSNCAITKNCMYRLATNSTLKVLRLNSCNLTSDIASPLFDKSSNMSSLAVLHLKVNPKVTFKVFKGVERLDSTVIEQILPNLRTVNMGGCMLGQKGAALLAKLCGKSLKLLYLEACNIGTSGALSILNKCPELMSVNMADNSISFTPAENNVPIACTNLRRLKLRRNNLVPEGATWLVNQLIPFKRIWSIELDHNKNLGNVGAECFLQIPQLSSLSLNGCGLTDEVIVKYFDQQNQQQYTNNTLEILFVAENMLTDASAKCLFMNNHTLKGIVISKNQLTEEGISAVVHTSAEKVWLEGYTVTDECRNKLNWNNLPLHLSSFRL
jgi:Ran GTPase-activating protein (RanGAP) involved in mRNA processing and transport